MSSTMLGKENENKKKKRGRITCPAKYARKKRGPARESIIERRAGLSIKRRIQGKRSSICGGGEGSAVSLA